MKNKILIISTLVLVFGFILVSSKVNAEDNNAEDHQNVGVNVQAQAQFTNQVGVTVSNEDGMDSEDSHDEMRAGGSMESEMGDASKSENESKTENEAKNENENENKNGNEAQVKEQEDNQNEDMNKGDNSNNQDSSESESNDNKNGNDNKKEDDNSDSKKMSAERMSAVVAAVQDILSTTSNEKSDIGDQVSEVAQKQIKTQAIIEDTLGEVENRSSFVKFFIGPKYSLINTAQKLLKQSQDEIDQLNKLQVQISSKMSAKKIANQINVLKQTVTQTATAIRESEKTFSLFGWLARIFVKNN